MKKNFKKIWDLYKPFKKVIFVLVFMNLIREIIVLIPPILYAKIVDSVISKTSMRASLKLVGIMFVLAVIGTIISHIQQYIEVKYFEFDLDNHIQNKNISKILEFSIGQNTNENSGVKQSIINRGQKAITQFTDACMFQYVQMILKVIVAVIAMFCINIFLGLIVIFGTLTYILISIIVNKKFSLDMKKMENFYSEQNKEQMEILHNVEIIKTNAQESVSLNRYDKILLKLRDIGIKIWIKYINLMRIRSFVSDITEATVMGLGVYFVFKGMYTPGTLIIFWSWSSKVFSQLWIVGQMQRNLMKWSKSIEKYIDLMDMECDVKEKENPVRLDDISGTIEFKNVSFKYPYRRSKEEAEEEGTKTQSSDDLKKAKPALKNISFKIDSGQKVAFVGESGAGKSTIVQLLIRAYDTTSGKVLIDGVNLKDLSLKDYRRSIGVVPQDVGVFDRTLKENIIFSVNNQEEDISEERLDEISKLSCIDRFKHRLEYGYNTLIGEKGIKLSGGERQRVGIARALIKDPAILIFDEATSHLDTENELLIHTAIDKISKGRTTIIIAHRLSTIKNADKIFVMEKGKIVGKGKHEELLENCKVYNKLVSHQTAIIV